MPRPLTVRALDSLDAATRGVHLAAFVAASRTPSQRLWEMFRLRNSYGSSLAAYASSSIIPSSAKNVDGSIGARRAPVRRYPGPTTRLLTIRLFGTSYISICDKCTENRPPP